MPHASGQDAPCDDDALDDAFRGIVNSALAVAVANVQQGALQLKLAQHLAVVVHHRVVGGGVTLIAMR